MAFHDLVDNFSGLPSALARSRAISFSFSRIAAGNVFPAQIARVGRRDVHGDVVHQFLEIVGPRHEIGFAVDFHHHAQLPAGVNVGSDQSLARGAPGLLPRHGDAALAQDHFGLGDIAVAPSTSAFLHSIMPAPVRSRSSLTNAAVISAI